MAFAQDSEPHGVKRKRQLDPDDAAGQPERIPQPPPPQAVKHGPINYISKTSPAQLSLIQADHESFSELLSLMSDYEGVLGRHESLAAQLGAKLTGARFWKGVESSFEGTIKTTPRQNPSSPSAVSWYDIVLYAKSNPKEFEQALRPAAEVQEGGGTAVQICQFNLKGYRVEISEEDWRYICSKALDRVSLDQPFEDDEMSELATLEIIEQRLQVVIKKADEVAKKARQLNYSLAGRKAYINSKRPQHEAATSSGFQPVNQPHRSAHASGSQSSQDLQAGLLRQFTASTAPSAHSRALSSSSVSARPSTPGLASSSSKPAFPRMTPNASGRTPLATGPPESSSRDESDDQSADASSEIRAMIVTMTGLLARGERVYPPCDRCRRLKVDCIKHQTACQGCTKKHAKCNWRVVTEEEAEKVRKEAGEKLAKSKRIYSPCERCKKQKQQCVMPMARTKTVTACQGCTRSHVKCSWSEDLGAIARGESSRIDRDTDTGEDVIEERHGTATRDREGGSVHDKEDLVMKVEETPEPDKSEQRRSFAAAAAVAEQEHSTHESRLHWIAAEATRRQEEAESGDDN